MSVRGASPDDGAVHALIEALGRAPKDREGWIDASVLRNFRVVAKSTVREGVTAADYVLLFYLGVLTYLTVRRVIVSASSWFT